MKTPKTKPTGANRGNGERILCSLRSLLFKSGRDGDADLIFLAATPPRPTLTTTRLLVATKPELREYKAVYVPSDAEIGLFSDEVVVNCAP